MKITIDTVDVWKITKKVLMFLFMLFMTAFIGQSINRWTGYDTDFAQGYFTAVFIYYFWIK